MYPPVVACDRTIAPSQGVIWYEPLRVLWHIYEELVAAQVDKNVGSGSVPAYVQATECQIINNVATTQGGGISAATSDAVVLYNTELSGNFGETFLTPHPIQQVIQSGASQVIDIAIQGSGWTHNAIALSC